MFVISSPNQIFLDRGEDLYSPLPQGPYEVLIYGVFVNIDFELDQPNQRPVRSSAFVAKVSASMSVSTSSLFA